LNGARIEETTRRKAHAGSRTNPAALRDFVASEQCYWLMVIFSTCQVEQSPL
jgi:hypothetical protein